MHGERVKRPRKGLSYTPGKESPLVSGCDISYAWAGGGGVWQLGVYQGREETETSLIFCLCLFNRQEEARSSYTSFLRGLSGINDKTLILKAQNVTTPPPSRVPDAEHPTETTHWNYADR